MSFRNTGLTIDETGTCGYDEIIEKVVEYVPYSWSVFDSGVGCETEKVVDDVTEAFNVALFRQPL